MTARRSAYTAEWVLPISSAPIRDGVVVVEGERIAFVGPAAESRERWADAREVPLGRAALLPGLVNAHSHLELTALRGFLETLPFWRWLQTLTSVRNELLGERELHDSALAGIGEALRNGITTLADTTASGAPLAAMREAGVRGVVYVETFGPDPAQATESLRALRAAVDRLRPDESSLVRVGVSPHAPYTVSAPLYSITANYAVAASLPMAVHIAESVAESVFVREGDGPFADRLRERGIAVAPQATTPIALLATCGVLSARPLLIHAVQLQEEANDVERIADSGATVVHCPISNAKLGHGIAPLLRLRGAGVTVGLGTDSVASNDRMDLLGEARQAALLASAAMGVPDALPAHDALAMATIGGARALGLGHRIGTLEEGKDADLAAFPLDGPDVGYVHDPAVSLIHVVTGTVRARLVTVAGRELVVDGVVTGESPSLAGRMESLGRRVQQWGMR